VSRAARRPTSVEVENPNLAITFSHSRGRKRKPGSALLLCVLARKRTFTDGMKKSAKGQKCDLAAPMRHFRFTPIDGHSQTGLVRTAFYSGFVRHRVHHHRYQPLLTEPKLARDIRNNENQTFAER
jgi:hypothetical protein